jgi:hypothetical protein
MKVRCEHRVCCHYVQFGSKNTHTHTHTHTYSEREREREGAPVRERVREREADAGAHTEIERERGGEEGGGRTPAKKNFNGRPISQVAVGFGVHGNVL